MRKMIFLILCSLITFSLGAESGELKLASSFDRLMQKHIAFLNSYYKNPECRYDALQRTFFISNAYKNSNQASMFFAGLERKMSEGSLKSLPPGSFQSVSFTKFVIVNGQTAGVSYSYRASHDGVYLTKQTSLNGHSLRANYYYNPSDRLLKVKEYIDNKEYQSQKYYEI